MDMALSVRQPASGMTQAATPPAEPQQLADLMASAQAGDADAYATLLRSCVPLIRRIARQANVPVDSVDDVVQDTLMSIHRARHTYDPARPFTPWLRAIVQRRGIDVARRAVRVGVRETHAPVAYDAHPDPSDGAEETLARRGRADRLVTAVKQLPPGQREALEQLGLQERSLAEVSARTGRSVGALKVNLHRALRSLRTILGEKDG